MKNTVRQYKKRRTSRRRVRKNKTMKGGLFGKYGTVSADTFKTTGYARAKQALDSYPVKGWPVYYRLPNDQSKLNAFTISELYKKVPTGTVPKYVLKDNQYVQDGNNTVPTLNADEFKEILEYIINNKIEDKSNYLPVQVVRNDRYANFAESLDYFLKQLGTLQDNKEGDYKTLSTMPKQSPPINVLSMLSKGASAVSPYLVNGLAGQLSKNTGIPTGVLRAAGNNPKTTASLLSSGFSTAAKFGLFKR